MKKDVAEYVKKTTHSFFDGLLNLFIFFPYFFSVSPLLKTLFLPWKNMVTKKTERGFSFGEFSERLFLNLISRLIGTVMRISIILFYLLLQFAYVIALPLILSAYVLILPLLIIHFLYSKTDEEQKQIAKERFVSLRLLKEENRASVEAWFELYYATHLAKKEWWTLDSLLSQPPLARDWSMGYTPYLDEFSEDLTSVEYQTRSVSIVGRNKEIEGIEEILTKRSEANVMIVGEEGVGKHTIVDALAKRIYEGKSNALLAYKRILKLNLEKILTVYTDSSQREHFLENLFSEAHEAKNVILLIENIDRFVSYDQGRVDLTSAIEKFGKTSNIQFIGITIPFFYQRFIFVNEKINRIFSKLDVLEITKEQAIQTLLETAYQFEERNRVIIPYETIIDTIDKCEFYITHIPFPEKAFNLLDTACASYNQSHSTHAKNTTPPIITPEFIDLTLSKKTHIPTRLTDEMKHKLLHLEADLSSRVIHQNQAISQLAAAMRRSFILLGKRKKPLASFLFLGPTGVGKTETAKALADIFFGSEKYLLRFDMSLYQKIDDIKILIGSIESGIPGLLSKHIRENPYAVLLLDEIEKADKDLLNIFLTLTDEGYFTDGFGKKVDCKNLMVIATSNAGADYLFKEQNVLNKLESLSPSSPVPVQEESVVITNQQNNLLNHLVSHHIFTPEFLNRFDGVITYNPVTQDSILIMAKKMIDEIKKTIYTLYKIKIEVSDTTLQAIITQGYNPAFGARNLQRIITTELEDKIAGLILENKIKEYDTVTL